MGLVTPDGGLEHYDGKLRFVDARGSIVADQLDPASYHEYIGEAVEPWSYLKFPYYKPLGYPGGHVPRRPARAAQRGVPLRHARGRRRARRVPPARPRRGPLLLPLPLRAAHRDPLLRSSGSRRSWTTPIITDEDVRAVARRNRCEGVGCSEAPARHALPRLQGDARAGSSPGST